MSDRSPNASTPRVLTIAGSDSGGGAGIQADIKVITCLGGYAMSAVTALTAQNTVGVFGIQPVPPEFVAQQIELCVDDIGVDAVKTGMLCNAAIVRAVAGALKKHPIEHLVVDPVIFSKSRHRLLDEEAEQIVVGEIVPLAEVITPNLPEASSLAGFEVSGPNETRKAAEAILKLGARAVIIKGGHSIDSADDLLFDGKEYLTLPAQRIDTKNTHGTGCSFSAALATELGRGRALPDAARHAKAFITEAIRCSFAFGAGCGPTNPVAGAERMLT